MPKGLSFNAQHIISYEAQKEAVSFGSDSLLPEHLILAMLKKEECTAYKIFKKMNLNFLSFQFALEQSFQKNEKQIILGDRPPSRRLSVLFDVATVEAKVLKSDYIGTEHLFLAALREGNSVVNKFFTRAGIFPDDVRSLIINYFTKSTQSAIIVANNKKNVKQNISFIAEFSTDITEKAKDGLLDNVIGRDKEIQRVIQILARRTKNNPILIGEPGVGKTAIVEGLAQRIVSENVPRILLNKKVLSLDLAQVISGTKYRGEFEERIKRIIKEVKENKDIILFIDEMHTIVGAGGGEGAMDASNMLKPALSRGELQCIGATTLKEYRKYFEKDAALVRRFQTVKVVEPTEAETELILLGLKKHYEDYHGVFFSDDICKDIVKLSVRYLTDRFLPDKAIDIMDEAGAIKKIEQDPRPFELVELEEKIEELSQKKDMFVHNQDYEGAAKVRDEVRNLKKQLESISNYWRNNPEKARPIISKQDICNVVSSITGIPLEQLDEDETNRLVNMENELHKTVIGQKEAIKVISSAIRRSRAGVSSTRRPTGSFIFLGPTGVGKTLLAKTLAKFLFGSQDSLIRIDMSDYMEKHNSSKLVGAPPGYVGYDEGGVLTEKVRRNPYSVILFDEIEKAHPEVFNLLLQILEEGELSDSTGTIVNFRNTIIIMTSNVGAREISNEGKVGFASSIDSYFSYDEIKSNAMHELKKIMRPELLNRIDDTIVFSALTSEEISEILKIQLDELRERLAEQNIDIKLKPKAKEYLIKNGYDPAFGARPMRRLIQKEIEDPLATKIIQGSCSPFSVVIVDCKNENILLNVKKQKDTFESIEKKSNVPSTLPTIVKSDF
ncbi:MAG: ATP-dependent Clp protease ATP-binding subunit [Treponema sp.]|nr:ATP-dependent Clp protease ATP-binding subunit [Treponema sp.]